MADQPLTTPDLARGIAESELRDGELLLGHAHGEAVVLVRDAGTIHALSATCTHYGGPLAEGRVFGGALHCPWHHACFDLDSGRAHGPGIDAVACFDVALEAGTIRVGAKRDTRAADRAGPKTVVIVGGGAAGIACAEALRFGGHRGGIAIVNGEGSEPVDRPNLSKDYLAGGIPEEWAFLRTRDALKAHDIDLVDGNAIAIDPSARTVRLANGSDLAWDALLIATGAEPIRLALPGVDAPHVHTLRTLADSRAIGNAATAATHAVVIGSSFIGLEVAASLRARGAAVTVVGPDPVPLARVLGDEVGAFVKRVHESKGVEFRLGRKPAAIDADRVTLDDGTQLPANLVVMGVGVKPRTDLAATAGLRIDRGVLVDPELRASPGIWIAGDLARYPYDGELVRIEHWQVAVRQGQAVARSMLGQPRRPDVPFFWSQHHDVTLAYVGHAERFDRVEIVGSLDGRDAHAIYRDANRIRAVLTVGRDRLALDVEAAMERSDAAALEGLV